MNMYDYLYRGMNETMFEELNGELTPRGNQTIAELYPSEYLTPSENLFPGNNMSNAIDKHQNPNRFNEEDFKENSAYLSTTPFLDRAAYYATNDGKEIGYVFVIDRKALQAYSISEYVVSDIATIVTVAEDKEILLLSSPYGSSLPKEVIIDIKIIHP